MESMACPRQPLEAAAADREELRSEIRPAYSTRRPNLTSLQIPSRALETQMSTSARVNFSPGSTTGRGRGLPPRPNTTKCSKSPFKSLIPQLSFTKSKIPKTPDSEKINLLLRKPPSPSTTSLSSNPHAFALTRLFSSPSVKRTHSLPVTPFSNPTAVQTLPETHVVDLSNCDKPQLHNHIKRSLSVPGNVKERSLVKRSESFGTMIRVIPVTPRPIIAEGETVANASTEITIEEEEDGEDIPEEEAVCRICFDELAEGGETLKMECSCRGELALAHQECAVKWFNIKGNKICDVCKQDVQNLSVTILRIQNPQFGRRRRNGIQQQGEIIQPVFWQDIPVLVLVSMLAYFCLLEQLLMGDMGRRALALSFPFACVLAVLSSMIAASMVNRNYIWAFASFQFAVLILFAHIFYTVLQMGAVLAVLLSSFTGFGLAISACSLLAEFWRWRSRQRFHQQQVNRNDPHPTSQGNTTPNLNS